METSIARTFIDSTAMVTVHGEIDFSNADELARCVLDAIADWSPAAVEVELRDATFIDSTGLGALIEGYRAATQTGTRFAVVNPTPALRRVLTVTGLGGFFGLPEPAGQDEAEPRSGHRRIGNDPRRGRRGPSEDSAPGGSSRIDSVIAGGATTEGPNLRMRPQQRESRSQQTQACLTEASAVEY